MMSQKLRNNLENQKLLIMTPQNLLKENFQKLLQNLKKEDKFGTH